MSKLTNVTINEISIGQKATYTKTCTADDITLFAKVSGDVNPVHLDDEFAATTPFGKRIAHGMYTGALVSAALAVELPGPGTIYLGQELKFKAPVFINDEITVELEVETVREEKAIVGLKCTCTNQEGTVVAVGNATVMAPKKKMEVEAPALPSVTLG
ncbi:(R)-specific enoyl-CoA hydratase [BD1-7 clade bacterium]|uniref:(R)-specific enoyl-CoA hydratase n=1 Tax=BD1-7 clade bacterium TaxID=2029982 RepID=A0A5S9PA29_9GAMM|nr:(R)-specific enoyl-CoA hydratase [BD1-7 clade bacterium]